MDDRYFHNNTMYVSLEGRVNPDDTPNRQNDNLIEAYFVK